MDFILGLFVGLTFWEFAFFSIFMVIGIVSSQYYSMFSTLASLGIFLGSLWALGSFDIIDSVSSHPIMYIIMILAYALLGGLYSLFVTWPEYIKSQSYYIKSAKNDYDSSVSKGVSLSEEFFNSSQYKPFTAKSNVIKINGMIGTWFFDLIWRVLCDPITWLWNTVYNMFETAFVKRGEAAAQKVLDDE